MKRLLPFAILAFSAIVASPVMGQSADTAETPSKLTIRVDGGWNTWVLGSAAVSENSVSGVSASGLALNADFLVGPSDGLQYGLGAAYLPMLSATVNGSSASIQMFPIVFELFLNNDGPFYADLGIGAAFLSATSNANEINSTSTSSFAPSPGIVVKAGMGLEFKVNKTVGIDLGADMYLPFTSFGLLSGSEDNALVDAIAFTQFELKAGVAFNL